MPIKSNGSIMYILKGGPEAEKTYVGQYNGSRRSYTGSVIFSEVHVGLLTLPNLGTRWQFRTIRDTFISA